jgi:hypothetical protein
MVATAESTPPQGLLENDGIAVVSYGGRELARGLVAQKKLYEAPDLSWTRWDFDFLRWTALGALIYLQGASPGYIYGGCQENSSEYILLRATPTKLGVALPGMLRVVLAHVHRAPDNVVGIKLFRRLSQELPPLLP